MENDIDLLRHGAYTAQATLRLQANTNLSKTLIAMIAECRAQTAALNADTERCKRR